MSIQQVQTQNLLELVSKAFLSGGKSPLLDDIYRYLNRFFGMNAAGLPFEVPADFLKRTDLKSDPDYMNAMMAVLIANVDILYETCLNHVDETMLLNTILRSHLDRLQIKRNLLNSQIDDYLLGIYNSDGYFYSFSDTFSTLAFADMKYTTAFLDTAVGAVMIPAISSKSKLIDPNALSVTSTIASDSTGKVIPSITKSRFEDAFDGLNNTAWLIEVKTTEPPPISLIVELGVSNTVSENLITRIDLDPHNVTSIQYGINATYKSGNNTLTEPFSNQVKTTTVRRSYVPSAVKKNLNKLSIQMKKEKADYEINDGNESTSVYMFGFKEMMLSEQYFDPEAHFVSTPISLPAEMGGGAVIDAVSMVIEDSIPNGTSLKYYIAANNPDASNLQDFNWVSIEPLSDTGNLDSQIIKFNGSTIHTNIIRLEPRTNSEIKQYDFNSTNVDLSKRNPTTSIFPGLDVYKIAPFGEAVLMNSLTLEEGFNTTKIYYTKLIPGKINQGFNYWKTVFDKPTSYKTAHGEIDSGHGFLYGADIGLNGQSVYAETYIYINKDIPVTLKECRKSDANSKTWAIKVFLNGREIANLPVGTDTLTVPWKFNQGKNHIVTMAEIPGVTPGTSAPYIGSFDVMSGTNLSDYGVVKLDDWAYVDNYKFQKNLTSDSKAFTIYNGIIISLRKPTDNFRINYNKIDSNAPESVRFRADFTRDSAFPNVTPVLDSYRMRFSYDQGTVNDD